MLFDLQISQVVFIPQAQPHAQSLFLFPIVFGINVSYVQSHHFPWLQPHELQSIRSSRLSAIRTHHPISHVSLGEAHSRLPHTVFPPKGLLLSGQGGCSRRPYQGKGLSSRRTSGSKISLTAGFEPCPQGPAPSSLAAAHSPFYCVPSFVLVHSIPVLAASHSSLA